MQLGIFAKTFDGKTAGVVLPHVRNAGFTVAQYNLACSGLLSMPDAVPDAIITEVKQAVAATGLHLNALSATYNMIHPSTDERNIGHRRLAVLAQAAQQLGIPVITLCTGTRDPEDQWKHHPDNATPGAWRDLLQSMHIAIGIADRFNVDLGIEPELANVVNSAAQARRLMDELKSPRIKIVFDPANLFETESVEQQRHIISHALDLLGEHITMAHAKDRLPDGRFVAAGTGVLDYPHFIRTLKKTGFNGPLVTHGLRAAEAPRVAAFLKQQLQEEHA
jgi:sugar phosphate isomerase/epimerase